MNTSIPVNNRASNSKTYSKTYFRKFFELCLVVTLLLSVGFLASCKKKSSLSGLPPSAPTSLTATAGLSNVTISWVNPPNAGYADDGVTPLELKSISVIYTKSNSQTINTLGDAVETITLAANQTNVVIYNLAPDTDYLYTVVVVNSIEEAATSDIEQFKTFSSAIPTAPANLTVTARYARELYVSFTAGANATSHTLRWRVKGGTYNTASTVTSPHSITGLTANTEYEVEVTAMNSRGVASATATGTTSQATAPGEPGIVVFDRITSSGFLVTWKNLSLFGKNHQGVNYAASDISYVVTISPSNTGVTASKSSTASRVYNFSGLSANTEYTVTITPSNPDGGAGPSRIDTQSTSVAGVPEAAPGQTSTLLFSSVTATSFGLFWGESTPGNNPAGTPYALGQVTYAVVISPSNSGVTITGDGPSIKRFTGLSANTEYTVTVTPSNPNTGALKTGPARVGKQTTLP